MNRLDRALGILLLLRSGSRSSARELASQFEVSARTIYRDIEALSALGVPIYSERGRHGGIRLLEGYFLPPVHLTPREALALLLGVTFLGSLGAQPFTADLDTAAQKLIAAVPESLRQVLHHARQHLGFEMLHTDIFHPATSSEEAAQRRVMAGKAMAFSRPDADAVGEVVTTFVLALVRQVAVTMRYSSPYRPPPKRIAVTPLGAFWDRGYWYLVGTIQDSEALNALPRLWRADRVVAIQELESHAERAGTSTRFDIAAYLGGRWLQPAMQQWAGECPVRIRLTAGQAERLREDWYYRHAVLTPTGDGHYVMTFGETDEDTALQLVRWLGPGAELLAPAQWRAQLRQQLTAMADAHREGVARPENGAVDEVED
jgi:predicted DNA-binding transcriptional regulator YafY